VDKQGRPFRAVPRTKPRHVASTFDRLEHAPARHRLSRECPAKNTGNPLLSAFMLCEIWCSRQGRGALVVYKETLPGQRP
jgi:hypothetical protein